MARMAFDSGSDSSADRAVGQGIVLARTRVERGSIVVGDRYTVLPGSPIPSFDQPGCTAVEAQDHEGDSVFALITDSILPPRLELVPILGRLERSQLIRPLQVGVARPPDASGNRFIIILTRPAGGRVMQLESGHTRTHDDERIARNLLRPAVGVLRSLHEFGLTHRAIRVTNMFYEAPQSEVLVLGECVSTPAGMHQPPEYEPIDSAMCTPSARGEGLLGDDLYALGVTALIFIAGRNPFAGVAAREIIDRKQFHGSYGALTNDITLPIGVEEPLRGLLADETSERWTLLDLETWLNGRRGGTPPPRRVARAERPFLFDGNEFDTAEELAQAYAVNWQAALESLKSDPVEIWVRRVLENEDMGDRFAEALRGAGSFGGRNGQEDRELSRVLIALDPTAPIRYRGFSARPEGLFQGYMAFLAEGKDTSDVQSVVSSRMTSFLMEARGDSARDNKLARHRLDVANEWISVRNNRFGYGLERTLYELYPGCPCMSPMVLRYGVVELPDLIPALDSVASEDQNQHGRSEPVDHHIAAFIAARLGRSVDQHLRALGRMDDDVQQALATVRLLAEIDQTSSSGTPSNLMRWMIRLSEPVVESYRSRNMRARIRGGLKSLLRQGGKIKDVLMLIDDPNRRIADEDRFKQAVGEYRDLEQQIRLIEGGEATQPISIERRGQQLAAMISASLASLAVVGFVLYKLAVNVLPNGG